MKTCPKCQAAKPFVDFNRDRTKPDGRSSYCRSCNRQKSSEWVADNRNRKQECDRRYHASRIGNRDPHKPWPEGETTYNAVHLRLKAVRGSASNYLCVDCGEFANSWSYSHDCPDERQSGRGPYSLDGNKYEPRCHKCHNTFDQNWSHRVIAIA